MRKVLLVLLLPFFTSCGIAQDYSSITITKVPTGDTVYTLSFNDKQEIVKEGIYNHEYWSSSLIALSHLPRTNFPNIHAHYSNAHNLGFNFELPYYITYNREKGDESSFQLRNGINEIPFPKDYSIQLRDSFLAEIVQEPGVSYNPNFLFPLQNLSEIESWNIVAGTRDSIKVTREHKGSAYVKRSFNEETQTLSLSYTGYSFELKQVQELIQVKDCALKGVYLYNDRLIQFQPFYFKIGNKVFRYKSIILNPLHNLNQTIDTINFSYHNNGQLKGQWQHGTNKYGTSQDFKIVLGEDSELIHLLSKEYSYGEHTATEEIKHTYKDNLIREIAYSYTRTSRPDDPRTSVKKYVYDAEGRILSILNTNHSKKEVGYKINYQ